MVPSWNRRNVTAKEEMMKRVVIVTFLCLWVYGCGGEQAAPKEYLKTDTGLKYRILKKTDGRPAKAGDWVEVHYVGRLTNGRKFDSSYDRGKPYGFQLGRRNVIRGWDEGIALLKVGEKAELIIPPELGYGDMGRPPRIPGGATLVFEVELVKAKR